MAPIKSDGVRTLLSFATSAMASLDFVTTTTNLSLAQPLARVTNVLMASVYKHTKDRVNFGFIFRFDASDVIMMQGALGEGKGKGKGKGGGGEGGVSTQGGGGGGGVGLVDPAACHAFLGALLTPLSRGAQMDRSVRSQLYSSLVFYLLHGKVTRTPSWPPAVVEKFGEWVPGVNISTLQHYDGVHEILEQGTVSLIQMQGKKYKERKKEGRERGREGEREKEREREGERERERGRERERERERRHPVTPPHTRLSLTPLHAIYTK